MAELFRISKGREFQMMAAATEKLRDPKPKQHILLPALYVASIN